MMNVDGSPNVRACVEPARKGMKIKHQNAWPSLDNDVLSNIGRFDKFLGAGFYYKSFIRPKFAWPIAERFIRKIAGLGEVDYKSNHADFEYDHTYLHPDIVVVGGGPAGMSAALEAAHRGMEVLLVDDQPNLGGHLLYQKRIYNSPDEYSGRQGVDIARVVAERVRSTPNIQILSNTTAFGLYEGILIGAAQGRRLYKIRPKKVIVAAGSQERPIVFENNDLPGIFLGSAAQRLVNLFGVKPGSKAVVVSSNDTGLQVAVDLMDAGVEISGLVETRESLDKNSDQFKRLSDARIPILLSHSIKSARGAAHVARAVVAPISPDGGSFTEPEREIPCDTLCISTGFEPSSSLLYQLGCKWTFDESLDETVPTELHSGLYAAGEVTGIHDLEASLLQGKIAGEEAARSLTEGGPHSSNARTQLESIVSRYRRSRNNTAPIIAPYEAKKKFVCICEDVTEKDIKASIAEGFDELETLKRYSTISMGPCQGKMCHTQTVRILAKETGRSVPEAGLTTSRPPYRPVSLGTLAGRNRHPVKLTPFHHKTLSLKAKMMNMGEWKRPFTYTSVEDEYRAIRERAGIIDVSTLGKMDIKGKDASKLLDKVYPHFYSNLKVGKVRYGAICDDAGIILDDGVVARLAEDHYFVTTSTGNVDFVEQWLKWWATTDFECAHVTNMTAGYATLNLAGPKARDVLRKLVEIDLSPEAFPYMTCTQASVAGVPTILLRIGFVGETGWEMHFPAEYGEYLWDKILEAGTEFDIKPAGVETQRVLRLEKRHAIVGQDTDALSNPLEADMSWIVKFEKDDFIGKKAILRVQERGLRQKLVGFVIDGPKIPDEGAVIVSEGRPVGRVTSSKHSPHVGRGVGLGWVPIELVKEDGKVNIISQGKTVTATLVEKPFYDPEGKRMRM
jgi:sarcosine oxidase subunit alpha